MCFQQVTCGICGPPIDGGIENVGSPGQAILGSEVNARSSSVRDPVTSSPGRQARRPLAALPAAEGRGPRPGKLKSTPICGHPSGSLTPCGGPRRRSLSYNQEHDSATPTGRAASVNEDQRTRRTSRTISRLALLATLQHPY